MVRQCQDKFEVKRLMFAISHPTFADASAAKDCCLNLAAGATK